MTPEELDALEQRLRERGSAWSLEREAAVAIAALRRELAAEREVHEFTKNTLHEALTAADDAEDERDAAIARAEKAEAETQGCVVVIEKFFEAFWEVGRVDHGKFFDAARDLITRIKKERL